MPLNILLADDSMTAQNMAKKILSEAGYEVSTVSNGAAALKKISDWTPDLVILDIYMPGYTGLEVCERLKRAPATSRVPVLLSVGKLEPYREQDATAAGADGVIIKPFEATELVTIVKNVILHAPGGAAEQAPAPPATPVAVQAALKEEPHAEPGETSEYPSRPVEQPQHLTAQPVASDSPLGEIPIRVPDEASFASEQPVAVENAVAEAEIFTEFASETPGQDEITQVPAASSVKIPTAMAAPEVEPTDIAAAQPPAEPETPEFSISEPPAEEKAPEEDMAHLAAPVFEDSPLEPAAPVAAVPIAPALAAEDEDIEIIEIPAPEPSVTPADVAAEAAPPETGAPFAEAENAVPLRDEATGEETIAPPAESPAIDFETFLRNHVVADIDLAPEPAIGAELVKAFEHLDAASPAAATPPDSGMYSLPGEAFPLEALAEPATPQVEEVATPAVADSQPVFEAEDAAFENPFGESAATPPGSEFSALSDKADAFFPAQPASFEPLPTSFTDAPMAAAVKSAFEPLESPSVEAQADRNLAGFSTAMPAAPGPLADSQEPTRDEPADIRSSGFVFAVPMVAETAAASSLPRPSDLGARGAANFSNAGSGMDIDPQTLGVAAPSAELSQAPAFDEAAIAGAVQRVMEKFKPQIVAEIIRELSRYPR